MASEVIKYSEELLSLTADSSEEDSKRAYDNMAPDWDTRSENVGYKGHVLCVEAFDKATQSSGFLPNPRKDIKILDAGAGTGMVGEMLTERGYSNIDALDISQNMLDIAVKKNIYKRLICAPLSPNRISEIETAEYDVVVSAGTIVYGQVKPGAIDEILRFIKPGGLCIFSIRVDSYDPAQYGFKEKCEELEKAGKWKLESKEERELHTSPNEERFRYCYVMTFKVLKQ